MSFQYMAIYFPCKKNGNIVPNSTRGNRGERDHKDI